MKAKTRTTFMPFGRYEGQPLERLPYRYLVSLLAREDLSAHLRAAVLEVLGEDVPTTSADDAGS